jgi:hypothetical protein
MGLRYINDLTFLQTSSACSAIFGKKLTTQWLSVCSIVRKFLYKPRSGVPFEVISISALHNFKKHLCNQ